MAKNATTRQRSSVRFDTTHEGIIAPERGPIFGRIALVLLPTMLVAGMLAGLIPMVLPSEDPADVVTKGMIAAAVGLGALAGLAIWVALMFPMIIVVGVGHSFMARSDGRARLVFLVVWIASTAAGLGVIYLTVGGIRQVGTIFGPSALLVGIVMVLLAPWFVWKRWRRPRSALDL